MAKKLIVLLLIVCGVSLGQGPPQNGNGKRQNMDAVRIWKLTESLELTEDQVNKFLPLINIHERKIRTLQKEIEELSKKGVELRKAGDLSQKDANKLIEEYTEKMEEINRIKRDFIKSLPKHLSPDQQMLYLGFEARFRKDLKQYMKDRKGTRGANRRRERP